MNAGTMAQGAVPHDDPRGRDVHFTGGRQAAPGGRGRRGADHQQRHAALLLDQQPAGRQRRVHPERGRRSDRVPGAGRARHHGRRGPSVLENAGTVRFASGTPVPVTSWQVTNTGTIKVESGIFAWSGANASFGQTAGRLELVGGNMSNQQHLSISGGALAGTGAIQGPGAVNVSGADADASGRLAGTAHHRRRPCPDRHAVRGAERCDGGHAVRPGRRAEQRRRWAER